MLPIRALQIIRDYSRPMTKPNWRKSKPIITTYRLYILIRQRRMFNAEYKLHYIMVLNNIENTDWHYTYNFIKHYGVESYDHRHFFEYGDKYHPNNLQAIDGIPEAIILNRFYYNEW